MRANMNIRIYASLILLLGFLFSCASLSHNKTLQNRLHNNTGDTIVFIEEMPPEKNLLSKEILNRVDMIIVPLNQLILIVKYADEGEYDITNDNRNDESRYIESHLFVLLKAIQQDVSQHTGLLLQFDGILNASDEGTIIPDVFYWEGMSYSNSAYSNKDNFELLFSMWNNEEIQMLKKNKQFIESLMDISISFINEKQFFGYRVHITLKTYNRLSKTSQDYETTFVYHIQ